MWGRGRGGGGGGGGAGAAGIGAGPGFCATGGVTGGVTAGVVWWRGTMATALELDTAARGGAGRGLRRGAAVCFTAGGLPAVVSGVAGGGTGAGTWTWALSVTRRTRRDGGSVTLGAPGLSHTSAPATPTSTTPAAMAPARRRRASAGVTVTVAVALVFSIVAVTVAVPAATAVARPLDDTVTISGCVEAQVAPCPAWVEPLRRVAVSVSWTAPPTAMVTSPGVIASAATFVVFPTPPRPIGVGLNGVLIRLPSCALLPAEARVTSCTCTGSPGASGAPPIAAIAASMLGQRFAGSFSSIRSTAAAT